MNINYVISPSSVTENCTAKAYEPQLDGSLAEVGSIPVLAPHNLPVNLTFTGLDFITHVIRLIGDTTGIEYHKYHLPPTVDVVTVFTPIFFKIGDGGSNTPGVGDTAYVNTSLAGLTAADIVLYRNGFAQFPGVHYDVDNAGGFHLIQVDDVFGPTDEIIMQRQPLVVTTPVNDSVVGKQWGPIYLRAGMIVDVTSTVDYIPAHLRALIRLAGHNAIYRLTSANIPPMGYPLRITNFGPYSSLTPVPRVQFLNAPCQFVATTITVLEIPVKGVLEVVWDGSIWNITSMNF